MKSADELEARRRELRRIEREQLAMHAACQLVAVGVAAAVARAGWASAGVLARVVRRG